jgi:hypothetical protein
MAPPRPPKGQAKSSTAVLTVGRTSVGPAVCCHDALPGQTTPVLFIYPSQFETQDWGPVRTRLLTQTRSARSGRWGLFTRESGSPSACSEP